MPFVDLAAGLLNLQPEEFMDLATALLLSQLLSFLLEKSVHALYGSSLIALWLAPLRSKVGLSEKMSLQCFYPLVL